MLRKVNGFWSCQCSCLPVDSIPFEGICLLTFFGIDSLNLIVSGSKHSVSSPLSSLYVSTPVKAIYCKLSVLKKVRLSVQAIHIGPTGITINKKRTRESRLKVWKGCLGYSHVCSTSIHRMIQNIHISLGWKYVLHHSSLDATTWTA